MITITTYTFIKIIMSIIKAVKHRKSSSSLISALLNIRYAEIGVSLLTMQQSMLVSFGEMEQTKIIILNTLTGVCVCLFILFLGIITIKNSKER